MFRQGDKVVHPMHGAGVIEGVDSKIINGEKRDFYLMRIPIGAMKVMIPVEGTQEIGVRVILKEDEVLQIMKEFPELQVEITQNWNHRYRENMSRLKSGDLREVALVIKGLSIRDKGKGLSTSERKMLHAAKQVFLSEVMLVFSISYEEAEKRMNHEFAS